MSIFVKWSIMRRIQSCLRWHEHLHGTFLRSIRSICTCVRNPLAWIGASTGCFCPLVIDFCCSFIEQLGLIYLSLPLCAIFEWAWQTTWCSWHFWSISFQFLDNILPPFQFPSFSLIIATSWLVRFVLSLGLLSSLRVLTTSLHRCKRCRQQKFYFPCFCLFGRFNFTQFFCRISLNQDNLC